MSTVGGAASAAAMSKARPTKAKCVIPSLGCACPFANSRGHPGSGRGCCGLPSAQREPCMGSCLGGCGGPAALLCFGHSLPLLRRMRRERRKRARVGSEAAPVAQAALVAQAAQAAPTAQGSVCLSVPTPLEPGPSLDPPSWWAYEGSEATPVAYPLPYGIHDGCPFDAPEGYAPSCLVLEELVSFGVLSHLRSGSRLDVSPFPPFLAQARAAVTVLLLVAHGL